MSLQIFDVEQGTIEWRQARLGLVTASEFETVLKKGRGGKPSEQRLTYMRKLAGEILTGDLYEAPNAEQLTRGREMEEESADWYSFTRGVELQRCGFMVDGRMGYSPDRLVGDDGLLEIKTALPHILIEDLLNKEFPEEHKAQCQGGLLVSGRAWIDIVVYWPKLPKFVFHAERDEEYIANLKAEIEKFNSELDAMVAAIRAMSEAA